jgi:hypothetical protein
MFIDNIKDYKTSRPRVLVSLGILGLGFLFYTWALLDAAVMVPWLTDVLVSSCLGYCGSSPWSKLPKKVIDILSLMATFL